MSSNVSLEQALQSYRVMNTPTKFSWKQHWAQETFSNDDAMLLDEDERKQFSKRLEECQISIFPNVRSQGASGVVCTLKELINTVVDPKKKNIVKNNRQCVFIVQRRMNVLWVIGHMSCGTGFR